MTSLEELITLCRRHNYGVNISFYPTGMRDSQATVAVSFFSFNQRKPTKLRSYSCQVGHDILEVANRAWLGLDVPFEENRGVRIPKPQLDLDSILGELNL